MVSLALPPIYHGPVTEWFDLEKVRLGELDAWSKPGVRGHPGLPPALRAFARRMDRVRGVRVLDMTGTAGTAGLLAADAGATEVSVLEPSAAALACARATHAASGVQVAAGLPWDTPGAGFDTVLLAPPGDRGNLRVEAEIRAAAALLPPDGRLLLAGDRDAGAKRYEKLAGTLFGSTEVVERSGGWRLLEATGPVGDAPAEPLVRFAAAGLELKAFKGTYAAGKLDPGSGLLLEQLGDAAWLGGKRVLDIGCGYGLLGLVAAASGGVVTAVDDDLAAVRSTQLNAAAHRLSMQVIHSDIDSRISDAERFDAVITNPPFHVGRGVRLGLPRAFIGAAERRLVRGGTLMLVANREQPYEQMLEAFSRVERVADQGAFKVIRAIR